MPLKPLGEVLVEERLITRDQLQAALERQKDTGHPLGRVVLEMGLVDERALVEAVARQIGIPFIDLEVVTPATSVVLLVPGELARKHAVIPVDLIDGHLLVAMAEPTNQAALKEVAALTGYSVRPALSIRRHILARLEAAARAASAGSQDTLQEVMGAAAPKLQPESKELSMHELMERVVQEFASDLHLTIGTHPTIRVNGSLRPLMEYPILQAAELRRLIYSVLTQRQREKLEADLELDCSYSLPGAARFRVNVFFQKDAIGAALRRIPVEIKSLEDLGVPPRVGEFAHLPRGLVLVTGPTGSGKSTTLAAVVDIANRERADHILTIEDPIEFVHNHKKALVNQREVGTDTRSFAMALREALRQDPDVILVGEMRDLETIQTAVTAAETGHLVFATLHTQSAPESIDRIIDVFPPHQQQQIRVQLSGTIQGIVTQQLLRRADGGGRVVGCEVLIATPAVRNLIREGKTHMIYSAMQAGGKYGMQTMDQTLAELVKRGVVPYDHALERCHSVEDFNRMAGRGM